MHICLCLHNASLVGPKLFGPPKILAQLRLWAEGGTLKPNLPCFINFWTRKRLFFRRTLIGGAWKPYKCQNVITTNATKLWGFHLFGLRGTHSFFHVDQNCAKVWATFISKTNLDTCKTNICSYTKLICLNKLPKEIMPL